MFNRQWEQLLVLHAKASICAPDCIGVQWHRQRGEFESSMNGLLNSAWCVKGIDILPTQFGKNIGLRISKGLSSSKNHLKQTFG
jgi:hypothetical protein